MHFAIDFLLLLLLLLSVDGKRKQQPRRKNEVERYRDDTDKNICNRENRDTVIACSCDTPEINEARSVSCYIFSDPEPVQDAKWDNLLFQRKMKELKLSVRTGGKLSVIPPILPFLEDLEILEIVYGVIPEIRPYAFGNSSRLRELVLTRNGISLLHPHAFAHLAGLESINLDDNRFPEIQPMVFHHVPRLRKLFMIGCNLSVIHDNAFRFVNNLIELELNSNNIAIITRETFNGLFRLQTLDLRANRLAMLGDYTFAELPELAELDLDLNRIEFIAPNAFSGLHRLMKLRLSENKLKTLSSGVFMELGRLQLLDLRDNNLEELKYELVAPLWDNFKNSTSHLLLDGNALTCDCRLSWMYSLYNETLNKQLQMELAELTCVSESEDLTESPQLSSDVEVQDYQQFESNGLDPRELDSSEGVEYGELEDEEEMGPPRKYIFKIPPEQLPCSESLVSTTTEEPDLINSLVPKIFLHSHSVSWKLSNWGLLVTAVCICKTFFLT